MVEQIYEMPTPERGDSIWKPSFSGSMFIFGCVVFQQKRLELLDFVQETGFVWLRHVMKIRPWHSGEGVGGGW